MGEVVRFPIERCRTPSEDDDWYDPYEDAEVKIVLRSPFRSDLPLTDCGDPSTWGWK